MQQATQTYLQYNPSACTSCQACLNNCPEACIYFDPLFIMSDECILCGQCLPECPEGVNVLASGSKLLGKEWFWFVQPQETSTDSKEESKEESSTDSKPSTDKPTTPTNPPTIISPKVDSIYAPPLQNTSKHKSYKRDRITKAIFIHDELKALIAH